MNKSFKVHAVPIWIATLVLASTILFNLPVRIVQAVGAWVANGTALTYSDGNVGIGIDSPTTLFQVGGSAENPGGICDYGSLTNPGFMFEVYDDQGGFDYIDNPNGLDIEGDYAYIVSQVDNGFSIIDISDPCNPIPTFQTADGANGFNRLTAGKEIDVENGLAYIITSEGFTIADVSNPAAPTVLSEHYYNDGTYADELKGPENVYVVGNLAFVGINRGLSIFDVTNPASPSLLSYTRDNVTPGFDSFTGEKQMLLDGNVLYVACDGENSLYALDVSNPGSPTVISAHVNNDAVLGGFYSPKGMVKYGNHLVITTPGQNKISFIDVTDPANPVVVNAITDGTGGFDYLNTLREIELAGDILLVPSEDALSLIDISDVMNPFLVSEVHDDNINGPFTRLNGAYRVKEKDGVAFVNAADAFVVIGIGGTGGETENTSTSTVLSATDQGNVGVGTDSPTAKLQVEGGDTYLADPSSGVILTSNNGNCFKLTVDNSGNLNAAGVTCP